MRFSPNSCRINQQIILSVSFVRHIHRITGRSGDVRYDRPLVFEDGIDQGGFPDIGSTHDCYFKRVFAGFFVTGDDHFDMGKRFRDRFVELGKVSTMSC